MGVYADLAANPESKMEEFDAGTNLAPSRRKSSRESNFKEGVGGDFHCKPFIFRKICN